MSELTICERHENADDWLLEVQQELRENKLSADNHAFLHGEPTSVPGSYVHGQLTCSEVKCRTLLVERHKDKAQRILEEECLHCKNERKRRKLVLTNEEDERLKQTKFIEATAIFFEQRH